MSEELRKLFNANGFDDETIRLAEIGHSYWREHKFEKEPHLHKVHLEATPTFWNMNGSAMDMFLMIAKGIKETLASQPAPLGLVAASSAGELAAQDVKEWATKEFWPKQPKCLGYDGKCDGDLPDEEHIPECPMFGKQPVNMNEFAEAYAAYRLAAAAQPPERGSERS